MRRTLYLARHGETDWNQQGRWQGHTDVALNEAGRAQARLLAAALGDRGIVQAWASDLARARETAEIVAAELGLGPVELDPGLRERGYGCFEGLTRAECAARFPGEWARTRADPRLAPAGGEPQQGVIDRMRAAVRRAAAGLPADQAAALLVSHGGAMRALVSSITAVVPPPLDNGAVFRLDVDSDTFASVHRVR